MRRWYPFLIVAITFAFSAVVYSRLPDPLPTHWNLRGEIDDYTSRRWAAWLMPSILLVVAIVAPRLPALDPLRRNYDKFRPTYDLVIAAVVTLMGAVHVVTLGVALGWPIRIERAVPFLVGGLFVLIGNLLPRSRPNWMFGIRTPWTLSNDAVWRRTHRLGGFAFVIGGLILMATGFLPPAVGMPVFIATTLTIVVVPLVYSFLTWRQEMSRAPNQ